jgi:hypothetical protein
MVEKFQKILENIEKAKGSVVIFALLKMDEFVDKWTVVFCASWATDINRTEVFEMIRKQITDTLRPEEVSEIARIAIYPKTEHFIQELLQYKSGTTIENKKINGNTVHYAHIIKSEEMIVEPVKQEA